jgi:hypothetical protein
MNNIYSNFFFVLLRFPIKIIQFIIWKTLRLIL